MHNRTFTRRASRGFTLIEILIALSMAGVLSSVAVPTFQGHLQKARRTDALVTMMQVQLAQSRWRANGSGYASLAQIGVKPREARRVVVRFCMVCSFAVQQAR